MTLSSFRIEHAWLAIVAAALLAIYLPGLANVPVFDDNFLTGGGLFASYSSPFELHARWLSYGSFVWLKSLFGDGWWKQRLVNLAIHAGVVVSLWALYREILRHIVAPASSSGAAREDYAASPALGLAIGFFALNPVAVYAVAYLIQRSILMATLFVVVGLWLFARGLREHKPWMHAAAFACYVLALLSKEYALFAPLAAVPLYIVVARPPARRLAMLSAGGLLLMAIAGWVLAHRYGDIIGKPFDEYSRVYLAQLAALDPGAEKNAYELSILNQAYLFFHYGLRWFIPWSGWMSIDLRPPFPLTWTTFPHVLGIVGYVGVLVGGFLLVTRYRDGRALVGLSLLFPALLFLTEFITVWVQDPFVLYRSYLWGIGVPGLVFFVSHGPPGRVLLAIGLAVGGLFMWQALDRVWSLATPEAAWTDAIEKLPRDPRSVGRWFPYLNRGTEYVDRDEFKLAMRDFAASASLGDLGMGMFNMGSLLSASGRHDQALAAFDKAEKDGYNLYNLPFQRGLALVALGRPKEGWRQFEITRSMDPPSPTREILLLAMGRTAMQLGMRDEAIASLERLNALDPRNPQGRYMLAMAYVMSNKYEKAHPLLDTLIAEKPTGPEYYARALANYGLKRKTEASDDIDNAIRLDPANAHLREWRAKIRAMP